MTVSANNSAYKLSPCTRWTQIDSLAIIEAIISHAGYHPCRPHTAARLLPDRTRPSSLTSHYFDVDFFTYGNQIENSKVDVTLVPDDKLLRGLHDLQSNVKEFG
jgi:hypothetical protein